MTAILVIVLAAVGFGGGFLLGQSMGAKKHYDRGYAAAWAEAKSKVNASSLVPPNSQTSTITGRVTAVGSASFDMETPSLARSPLDEQTPTTRTVNVTSSTDIVLRIERSREEVQKENEAYQAMLEKFRPDANTNETLPPPPSPFVEKKGALADIKTGMNVTVTAAEDIAYARTITATAVRVEVVTQNPGTPEPPPLP